MNLFKDISEVWRDPPEEVATTSQASIVKRETISNALTNIFFTEMQTTEMTNLGHILMGEFCFDFFASMMVLRNLRSLVLDSI